MITIQEAKTGFILDSGKVFGRPIFCATVDDLCAAVRAMFGPDEIKADIERVEIEIQARHGK